MSEQSKIEWPTNEKGDQLSRSEVLLLSDQAERAGDHERAQQLLNLLKENPRPIADELPPGEPQPVTEGQKELKRADKIFRGRQPHWNKE